MDNVETASNLRGLNVAVAVAAASDESDRPTTGNRSASNLVATSMDARNLPARPDESPLSTATNDDIITDWFPSWVVTVHTELVQITPAIEIKVGINTFFFLFSGTAFSATNYPPREVL